MCFKKSAKQKVICVSHNDTTVSEKRLLQLNKLITVYKVDGDINVLEFST